MSRRRLLWRVRHRRVALARLLRRGQAELAMERTDRVLAHWHAEWEC